jgi:hypothetical protein
MIQCEYSESSAVDIADGVFRIWVNGEKIIDYTNVVTDWSKDSGTQKTKYPLNIGFYDSYSPSDSSETTQYAYYQDVYVDTVWSRVEICSGSTWTAKGHCEIQPPTAWAATGDAVTVTVNQGTFGNMATVYVYVVDSAGAVNASGYEVTINGTPEASHTATLTGLASSGGTLSPTFDAATYTYTIPDIANTLNSITVTPTKCATCTSLSINGVAGKTSGVADTVAMSIGPNAIPITIWAEDNAANQTYTITVIRKDYPAKTGGAASRFTSGGRVKL